MIATRFVINQQAFAQAPGFAAEFCEHKGIGHLDSCSDQTTFQDPFRGPESRLDSRHYGIEAPSNLICINNAVRWRRRLMLARVRLVFIGERLLLV